MDRADRTKQFLALSTAAATVYFTVTGQQVDGQMDPRTRDLLCDVAHALSVLAPLYLVGDLSAPPTEIPAASLMGARFERAARVLVLADGTTQENLAIQRGDMLTAIDVLKEGGFGRRWKI